MACSTEGCLQVAVYFFPRFCWNIHLWVPSPCFPLSPHRCLGSLFSGERICLGRMLPECNSGEEYSSSIRFWPKAPHFPVSPAHFCYEGRYSRAATLWMNLVSWPDVLQRPKSPNELSSISLYVKRKKKTKKATHTTPLPPPTIPTLCGSLPKKLSLYQRGLGRVHLSWFVVIPRGKNGHRWMKLTACSQTTS